MDKRFLDLYTRELKHLRSSAQEFAREFPAVAHHLALDDQPWDGKPCPDPYVERLLEGFAFMAARVQQQIESGYPRFVQSLLESIYPHYLSPTPSMAMIRLEPDAQGQDLKAGLKVPAGTILRWKFQRSGDGAATQDGRRTGAAGGPDLYPVLYRTAHDVELYPIKITDVRYLTRDIGTLRLGSEGAGAAAALTIRLQAAEGVQFNKELKLDRLPIFLGGVGTEQMRLYEALLARAVGVYARGYTAAGPTPGSITRLGGISRVGFSANEALLPYSKRSFQGYRLLHEYFAFPQRFMSVALEGLAPAVQRCNQREMEIIVLLDRADSVLERWQRENPRQLKDSLALFTTPAINLFRKQADYIFITEYTPEHHVVVDRGRPTDYEVYSVEGVSGFDTRGSLEREFKPFYAAKHTDDGDGMYYTVHRTARGMNEQEARGGRRSSYTGSEVYISLVDATAAPLPSAINRLTVEVQCTNRDLPRFIGPDPLRDTDFWAELPGVKSVKLLGRPSDPWPSPAHGETMWRLVNHLSVNYLALLDAAPGVGASALRDLLRLYAEWTDRQVRDSAEMRERIGKEIQGLISVERDAITTRLDRPGPITFARGIELTVEFDDLCFEGSGPFLLGAVLEQFFARYVSINSFTQTVVRTRDRGEIMRWQASPGQRPLL